MTALEELRQALAEWDRLTEGATPGPWRLGVHNSSSATLIPDDGSSPLLRHNAPGRAGIAVVERESAEFIVAAVGLAPTVRAILADAIEHWAHPNGDLQDQRGEVALRLARAINAH